MHGHSREANNAIASVGNPWLDDELLTVPVWDWIACEVGWYDWAAFVSEVFQVRFVAVPSNNGGAIPDVIRQTHLFEATEKLVQMLEIIPTGSDQDNAVV
jgi:hypothetical protein